MKHRPGTKSQGQIGIGNSCHIGTDTGGQCRTRTCDLLRVKQAL